MSSFLPLPRRRQLPLPSRCFLARLLHSSTPGNGLDQAGPLACRLKSRSVLRFRGQDTIKFLQGLLTNDVRPLSDASASSFSSAAAASSLSTPNMALNPTRPVYSAMLTPQGRFLFDFFLYRPGRASETLDKTGSGSRSGSGSGSDGDDESEQTLLADVDATLSDEILNCLKKYRLRSKVEIENVSEKFTCWQRFGSKLFVSSSSNQDPYSVAIGRGGGTDRTGTAAAQGNNLGWRWYEDPRLCSLGFRGIFPSDTIPPLVECDETDEQNYLLWRVEKGIAEGSVEIPKGEAIPLEYNLVGLNAISFDKGCYVGQEFIARTHHRGVIRKRLVSLKFTDERGSEVEQKVVPGSNVVDTSSKKKVGNVTTVLGCRGMGVLRVDAFASSLAIEDHHDVKVNFVRPDWWPTEWTQDLD